MTNIKYSNRTLKFPRNQFLKIRLCLTTSLKDGNYKPFKHSRLYLHRFLPSCQGSTRWFCSHTLFERLNILGIYVLLVIKENRSHQKRHLSYNHFSHLHKSLQLYLRVQAIYWDPAVPPGFPAAGINPSSSYPGPGPQAPAIPSSRTPAIHSSLSFPQWEHVPLCLCLLPWNAFPSTLSSFLGSN